MVNVISVEYLLIYQKPKGYGGWYESERFIDKEYALEQFEIVSQNTVHAYRLLEVTTKVIIES